jgi:hypothetical protein
MLCYLRTIRKTVEEPDLVPSAGGIGWPPRIGSLLQSALVFFSFRSLIRSRQHRVAYSFFLAIVLAIALSMLRGELSTRRPIRISLDFLIPTFVMMGFAIFGLRSAFSLPISLTANWVLRTTQLRPTQKYIGATRLTLLLLAAWPVWLVSAALGASFSPFRLVAAHLLALALFAWLLVEISLVNFYKVPFTCSYLPGKINIYVVSFGVLIVYMTAVVSLAEFENNALRNPAKFLLLVGILLVSCIGFLAYNRVRAQSAVLYFEENPGEIIMSLNLSLAPTSQLDDSSAGETTGSHLI